MNMHEYRNATTARKSAIIPSDHNPALRVAHNIYSDGLPSPVFPVATPKTDSSTLPLGSEFFIDKVWEAYRVSGKLTVPEARERYEASLISRRAMEIRADNYRIGGPEAAFMAKQEVEFTPKPSDSTISQVIAVAGQLRQVAFDAGQKMSHFEAVEQASKRFR